jgi:hypothetical protein
MGPRRLQEIQEETLYAIDSKYRKMKKTMKISGIIGTTMFGFATLLKIQHWPYGGAMMVLGAITLAFIFMPSAIGVLWKETHSGKRLFLFISGFITGMLFIFGTLFKIQHWPVAGIILSLSVIFATCFFIPSILMNRLSNTENKAKRPVYILGTAGCILYITAVLFKIQHWPLAFLLMGLSMIVLSLVVLPWYTWLTWKNESHISSRFIFIVIGSLLIIVPGALINLNLRNMYNSGYYPHLEQEHKLYDLRLKMDTALLVRYRDSLCYRNMDVLHRKTISVLACLEKIEKKMIEESEGQNGTASPGSAISWQTGDRQEVRLINLKNPFSVTPARDFLNPACAARQELNNALEEYLNYVISIAPENDPGKFKGLLDASLYLPGDASSKPDLTLLAALHSVEILRNNILSVESSVMRHVVRY